MATGQATSKDTLQQPFTLYLLEQHVLARNSRGKVIDLGTAERANGKYHYRLDGDGLIGEGLATPQALLGDIAGQLDFPFLDGQFTSLPDLGEAGHAPDLAHAERLDIVLDEMGRGDGGGRGDTPDIF